MAGSDGPPEIRPASLDEADAIATVLRRSIRELCGADHGGHPDRLDAWLRNKTPARIRAWTADPGTRLVVACLEDQIVGVGAASATGEVTLNYVSPDFRGRGVSTALLAALERHLAGCGHAESRLTSTATARAFYLRAGYRSAGPPVLWAGIEGFPMVRRLGPGPG